MLASCLCALVALRPSPLQPALRPVPLQWVRSPPPSLVAVPSTELRIRTAELKEQLIQSCAAFKAAQKAEWDAQDAKGVGPQQATGERLYSVAQTFAQRQVKRKEELERRKIAKQLDAQSVSVLRLTFYYILHFVCALLFYFLLSDW